MLIVKEGTGQIAVNIDEHGTVISSVFGDYYKSLHLTDDEFRELFNAVKADSKCGPDALARVLANRPVTTTASQNDAASSSKLVKQALDNMINFFSEFNFSPSMRFTNTLVHICKESINLQPARDYVMNYFRLMDSPYAKEVCDKIKALEFDTILKTLAANATPTKTINSRLKVYFGAQGTGKTFTAEHEVANKENIIICNSSMQPSDLLEDFTFDDGKAAFHPSAMVKAMEEGKTIMLDEMNLLPFDTTMRFLQGLCDGKEAFDWKGHIVHIKEGFNIVGTMNLTVNGTVFALPEPIVDRCSELREFVITVDKLMGAI